MCGNSALWDIVANVALNPVWSQAPSPLQMAWLRRPCLALVLYLMINI